MSQHVWWCMSLLTSTLCHVHAAPTVRKQKYVGHTELQSIGIEFTDVSGDLSQLIEYEVEVIAEGFGFLEGPAFIDDYLLFTEPLNENIWKYDTKNNTLEVWANWSDELKGGCTAIAYSKAQPTELWIACMFARKVLKVDLNTKRIVRVYDHKTYHKDRDKEFAPNDIVVDDHRNVYFTDLPWHRNEEDGARGGVYHINGETEQMSLIQLMAFGPNGIALNSEQSMIAVANFVDVPMREWRLDDYSQHDWSNVFVRAFRKKAASGLLEVPFDYFTTDEKPAYDYMLHDEYDMIFDSNAFDQYDNLWQAVYFNVGNQGGQISIVRNDGDTAKQARYIGSIRAKKAIYAASNLEMGDDGYMYATCGSYPENTGSLLRFKVKNSFKMEHTKKQEL